MFDPLCLFALLVKRVLTNGVTPEEVYSKTYFMAEDQISYLIENRFQTLDKKISTFINKVEGLEKKTITSITRLEGRFQYLSSGISSYNSFNDEGSDNIDKTPPGYPKRRSHGLHVLKRHLLDFWNNISLPGFKYVGGEPGRHSRSDRLMWIGVLAISLMYSFWFISSAYVKWQDSPVFLTFNDTQTPVARIPFPAVTVCAGRRRMGNHTYQNMKNCFKYNKGCDSPDYIKLQYAASLLCPTQPQLSSNDTLFGGDYISLNSYIEQSAMPCEELIPWFKFARDGYRYPNYTNHSACTSSFQITFVEEHRLCYTFNMIPANEIFKQGVVPPVLDERPNSLRRDWTVDSLLEVNVSLLDQDGLPRYVDTNGRWSGIYMMLDDMGAEIREDVCIDNVALPKVIIHNPAELPMSRRHKSVQLTDRREVFLRLKPQLITAGKELEDYPYLKRGCQFSSERSLYLFKNYTQSNCLTECRSNCSLKICGCVPYYLPRISSTVPVCARELGISCSGELVSGYLENRFSWEEIMEKYVDLTRFRTVVNQTRPNCRCDCPMTCTTVRYDVDVEWGDIDEKWQTGTTRILIFFSDLEYTSILRKELIGFTDFIANSGGVLGVFTGFSFLALCELLYYLTLRLWTTLRHAWDHPDDQCNDN